MEKKKLDHFYTLIHTPVGREHELEEQGVEIVYTGRRQGHPWELNHPRLVNIGGFVMALLFACSFLLILWLMGSFGS